MLCESKITYGVDSWGLDEARKETDKIHRRFSKKKYVLGLLPRCAANK